MPSYDCHIHTCYSPDSESPPAEVIRWAGRRGLSGLCFTDHAEFAPDEFLPSSREVSERFDVLRRLDRDAGCDREIAVGVEIGYYPGRAPEIRDFLREWPFDFVLGTVHVAGGVRYTYESCDSSEADDYYRAYLDSVGQMLAEIDVDSVGHFDLPKRHGPQIELHGARRVPGLDPDSPHWPQVVEIIKRMLQDGVLMELNASGLRQPPGEPYPSRSILREYRRLGGELVTLGSDSHTPELVGAGMKCLKRHARRSGLSQAAWFRNRLPRQWSLV